MVGYNHCRCGNNIISKGLIDHFTEIKPDSDSESRVSILPSFARVKLLEICDTNLNTDFYMSSKSINQYEI